MKLRIAILLSLLLIAGLVSAIAPTAQAGMWIGDLEFNCEAKRLVLAGEPGLFYPPVAPLSTGTLYTVACGKHKPDKHVAGGVAVPEVCQASSVSPNGKKPAASTQTPSNCTLNLLAHVQGSCGSSTGQVLGSIRINLAAGGLKTIVLDLEGADRVQWLAAVGGNLAITGNTNKGTLVADAQASPDRVNKSESCAPPPVGDGADAFKIQGAGTITGTKTK